MCTRCGQAPEDDWHRIWQCQDNCSIDHWAIKKTDKLKTRAMHEKHLPCMWLKGIVPKEKFRYDGDLYKDIEKCGYT